MGSSATRLLVEDGAVVGAEIENGSGEQRVIRARSTLLATGGFGGDPALRAEHIGPLAADLPLRANTHSVGDGLKLGLSVGAAFGPPNSGFYGHLIPSKVAYNNPYEFTDLTFYHSEHGVLLNLEGRRFCDETIGDHLNTLYVLDQPEARALLVYDQRVHDEWEMAPYVEGVEPLDKFQLAYRRGARAAVAEDIDEFEALPEEWGYPGPASRDALLRVQPPVRGRGPDAGPQARRRAARHAPVLHHRGHPRDHVHVQRVEDRSSGASPRRIGPGDSRTARRRGGRRRCLPPGLRRRPRVRARVRVAGGRHRNLRTHRLGLDLAGHAVRTQDARWGLGARRGRREPGPRSAKTPSRSGSSFASRTSVRGPVGWGTSPRTRSRPASTT